MSERDHDHDMTYLAIRPECGHAIAASVDSPQDRESVAEEVASYVRRGFIVTRVTAQEAREADWCECPRKPAPPKAHQMALLDA